MTTRIASPRSAVQHAAGRPSRGKNVSIALVISFSCLLLASTGCWAPFRSYGIPARCLPDSFRAPMRTAGAPLNYSNLTIQPPADYILGSNDILEITIPGLFEKAEVHPIRVQVMASGEIHLPMVGAVLVGSKNLLKAQEDITSAYADGFLVDPRVSVTLAEKSTTSILVLGKVQQPGVHVLPKFENDVGHALAAAGGLLEESADVIEVHRRIPHQAVRPARFSATDPCGDHAVELVRFHDESAGLSYWVPDHGVNLDETALPLEVTGDVSLPVQSPASAEAAIDWTDPQYSEPWQVSVGSSTQTTLVRSAASTLATLSPATTPSYWQPPTAPNPLAPNPLAMTAQADRTLQVDRMPAQLAQIPAPFEQRVIEGDKQILRIPLRQLGPTQLSQDDISLQPGDVVVVPSRRHEVFFVVGQLSTTNNVRFTIGDREREIGVGFILPREREIDVVTAVVMAGYIDPIDSPTTVTLQRKCPNGNPLLIHVDLIKARYDSRETVLVQAGDIIYLNPDSCWWLRRTFDRIVPDLIIEPYKKLLGNANNR